MQRGRVRAPINEKLTKIAYLSRAEIRAGLSLLKTCATILLSDFTTAEAFGIDRGDNLGSGEQTN